MKVEFEYIPTKEGYKLNMKCSDMSTINNGAFNKIEYDNCFKAIFDYIVENRLVQ